MFASVTSAALVGVEPSPIRVEVHVSGRTRGFTIVGLPDAAVREARERVRSAIASSGHEFPARWVTVNLAPADVPKVGSAYDLPIALGVLAASGEVLHAVTDVVAIGELALDGTVRSARGGLAAGIVARRSESMCLVARDGVTEAALSRADVRGVRSLAHAVAVALGEDHGESGGAAGATPRPGSGRRRRSPPHVRGPAGGRQDHARQSASRRASRSFPERSAGGRPGSRRCRTAACRRATAAGPQPPP